MCVSLSSLMKVSAQFCAVCVCSVRANTKCAASRDGAICRAWRVRVGRPRRPRRLKGRKVARAGCTPPVSHDSATPPPRHCAAGLRAPLVAPHPAPARACSSAGAAPAAPPRSCTARPQSPERAWATLRRPQQRHAAIPSLTRTWRRRRACAVPVPASAVRRPSPTLNPKPHLCHVGDVPGVDEDGAGAQRLRRACRQAPKTHEWAAPGACAKTHAAACIGLARATPEPPREPRGCQFSTHGQGRTAR